MPEPEPIIVLERRDDVVTLTFNDPDRRNAMTAAMGRAFAERISGLAGDGSLRALILTGHGRAFSAGGDLGMIQERADEAHARPGLARRGVRDFMRAFYELFLSVRELPCPTLAAINGHAIGAGLCVALGCDIRYVAEDARLGLNFTKLGLHPGMGATWTLPRLVGPERAAELLYTSRLVHGAEAARMGLASRALRAADVLPAAVETAAEIAACAPIAVRGLKRALARSEGASLEDQLSFEASEQSVCFESDDVQEGITAARERREPIFHGQ
ncbi:MAG: enoyl-CoA hydratase/isomerase family protein [Deltaproteobacteria bacterium]|nr:enoyl-CoA hydratase/isomerase family protein [Deltaproteobacteria bacterium]